MNKYWFDVMRLATTVLVLLLAFVFGGIAWGKENFAVGLIIFVIITIAYFAQGMEIIPADPPELAVPEIWGRLVNCVIGPGYVFFPFYGWLTNYRLVPGGRIDFEIAPLEERTPADKGQVRVQPFFTYVVSKTNPVAYINAGSKLNAERMFMQRVISRLREWITSDQEGPSTWQEALKSNGPAVYVLIQKIFPGRIDNSTHPRLSELHTTNPHLEGVTSVALVKYFTGRPGLIAELPTGRKPTEIERCEVDWRRRLDELKTSDRASWNQLKKTIDEQLAFVDKIKGGLVDPKTYLPIADLGIDVTLAGMAGISAFGKTATSADDVAAAQQVASIQTIQVENLKSLVETMLGVTNNDPKLATEAVQLQLKQITKTASEQQYGLRPDNFQAIQALVVAILTQVSKGKATE